MRWQLQSTPQTSLAVSYLTHAPPSLEALMDGTHDGFITSTQFEITNTADMQVWSGENFFYVMRLVTAISVI